MAKTPKKIVLLVEDEKMLLETLTDRFKEENFTVFAYTNAPEALDCIKVEKWGNIACGFLLDLKKIIQTL